jgi:aldehyde:ferredoxin oxidoreductase
MVVEKEAHMYKGIIGKILRVDLSSGKITEEAYPDEYVEKYIGGDGIAARLIYDEVAPGMDALDPDALLVVSSGPLVGTNAQASCTVSVAAKSPLTGCTIYNSHSNGSFGRQLKFSGFDALVIRGKAEKPVFLWIEDGRAELRDGAFLWGMDTWETEEAVKTAVDRAKLSCMSIGPAGENLVLLSGITNDATHLAARGGLGAVMGSKKLKAIAVYGSREVPLADPEKFAALAREWREINVNNPAAKNFHKFGTAILVNGYVLGDLPINNWSRGTLEGWENLTGEKILEKMLKRHTTCPSCTLAHTKLIELAGGVFSGECELPEFEMLVSMGSNIGVTDPTVAAKGTELLDKQGLDGLGFSTMVGFAMECYEKGLISKEDTGGLDLRFGNWEAAFQMIEKIAKREGFGSILADGPIRAADYIGKGSDQLIMHVKGMPTVMHDFRSAFGGGLQYAIGSAGPAHEGGPGGMELSGVLPRFSKEGKAAAVKTGQEYRCFINTLGVCVFGTVGVPLDKIAATASAAMGLDIDEAEARKISRRLINLRRAFSIRHGLRPEDDTLPPKYTTYPLPDGGAAGQVIPVKPMVHDYYKLMGWDLKTGKPFRRILDGLGLEAEALDLWG